MRADLGGALAVLVLIVGCSAGSRSSSSSSAAPATSAPATSGTPTGPATPTTSIVAGPSVPETPTTLASVTLTGAFATPTRNIGCYVYDEGVRCDIRDRTWTPPPAPPDCHLDYGQGIELNVSPTIAGRPAGARLVCAGDTALDPTATVVPYGTAVQHGTIACDVESTGVTCTDSGSGHGFALSRDSYRIF